MRKIQDFSSIMIQLASSEQIRKWSYGEVKKPETINYRTLRPERDGLLCERIFGTTKEWECYCGKFKSSRYKGVVCDRCGVEVTHYTVRRERMGHVELAAPVSHIWMYRTIPSRIGLLLDISVSTLRSVLYYEKMIVIDPGNTDLSEKQLLTEEEYNNARERYGLTFTANIGAEAIQILLEKLNLDRLAIELREQMAQKRYATDTHLLKRIELVEQFRRSNNKPEWMILNVIPVIPPELRPMVQLDGGRFATSDLNDLYRRVINRNNRLKRLMLLNAPDIIIRNEKRMLQEAVDALFDNSKKRRAVKGSANRPLKSLSDMIHGKQGRFRQNLLGKRVDYSGRSVICAGPDLKLHQCGLPIKMALELFKPFIMKRLVEKDVVYNVKKAKTLVEEESPEVWEILDDVIANHPVLLNRAPTLHRLGVQAFQPILVDGKAIRLHPLVCHAFNADFDGDQMAVHVPLTQAAQVECWTLMLASKNLLNPADGRPIVFPSRDMVIGIYYLTNIKRSQKKAGKYFGTVYEALIALENKVIGYHDPIHVDIDGAYIETTAGRLLFNRVLPPQISYINNTLGEKEINDLIATTYTKHGQSVVVKMLDAIKTVGFKYATLFGTTIGMDDVVVPPEKKKLIDDASNNVHLIQQQFHSGQISKEECHNRVIDVWNNTNEHLTKVMMDGLKRDRDGFNPVYMMAHSGARGSRNQIRQLAGMRGLMAKPSGDIIELPIKSNFKEGLSILEFFISTNGARKGLADTALKTADAGYLTRRLVDISQDVVVNEVDCGTINGIYVAALKEGEDIVESLKDRISGRFAIERIYHPITNEVLIDVNQEITDEIAEQIDHAGIESARIRTVLACESRHGVCQMCYGRNLSTNRIVEIGEAVGVVAAQSIGQPGTQLTMRTFHIGGTATKAAEENRTFLNYPALVRSFEGNRAQREDGKIVFTRKGSIVIARIIERHKVSQHDHVEVEEGQKVFRDQLIIRRKKEQINASDNAYVLIKGNEVLLITQNLHIELRNGAELLVDTGDIVPANQPLAAFDPYSEPIISEYDGMVELVDVIPGTTMREENSEESNVVQRTIEEDIPSGLQPRIRIKDSNGEEVGSYFLPGSCYLNVYTDDRVTSGTMLARLPRESAKTSDITGGLPRVSELFEARHPKDAAVLTQIGGLVRFKDILKNKRIIHIIDEFGNIYPHYVPLGRHLLVRDGDTVSVGEKICSGNIDPHDILSILGEGALQNFLVNSVQEIYRLQGVSINDKHIDVIIRQMTRKVEIQQVGDTKFIFGQQVDKYQFREQNNRILRDGGQPAVARPLLLGITRASLNIDSFISAASFQETTRILTDAAIAGRVDTLRGLKENVIIGHLIPAGTGMPYYRNMKLFDSQNNDLDAQMQKEIENFEYNRQLEESKNAFAADMPNDMSEDDVFAAEDVSEVDASAVDAPSEE